jgi:hypothetical protein
MKECWDFIVVVRDDKDKSFSLKRKKALRVKTAQPTLTFPESTTNLTPSMVMDVSAMLVDTMHLRTFSGG